MESAVLTDVLKELAVTGLFLFAGVEAQGEVGAEEDFFVSDEVGYGAEDLRAVEEWTCGAVVVDVAEALAEAGIGFEDGEATAPVGEDDFEFGGGLGELDECLQGCGGVAAGVGVTGCFGDVEVDGPVVCEAPVGEGAPGGALGGKVLDADMELADTAEAECVCGFELGLGIGVGKDGGKADEAIGGVGDPLGDDLVVPAAGVFVLPVPAE